jgi:ABC-type Fe3+/spermidine/putrescine transport system ATPase subunit
MQPELALVGLTKRFGPVVAVDDVHLELTPGELVCVLGPSGCGKTTLLRLVAGFEEPTAGAIYYRGAPVHHLPPQERNFGIVFQSYALFPHMTVWDNVAFGLRVRRLPATAVRARVAEMLALVGLEHAARLYPSQLSGGMQQRVALARALAIQPRVLLLDEPLSALDAKIRVRLRAEIRRIQRELGVTVLYVTHDQEEALSIADRLVVMWQGRVQQVGPPLEVYTRPATPFVADFVGTTNLLRAEVREGGVVRWGDVTLEVAQAPLPVGPVLLAVRPERLRLRNGSPPSGQPNCLAGVVEAWTFFGPYVRLHVSTGGELVAVDVPQDAVGSSGLQPQSPVTVYVPPDAVLVFPECP